MPFLHLCFLQFPVSPVIFGCCDEGPGSAHQPDPGWRWDREPDGRPWGSPARHLGQLASGWFQWREVGSGRLSAGQLEWVLCWEGQGHTDWLWRPDGSCQKNTGQFVPVEIMICFLMLSLYLSLFLTCSLLSFSLSLFLPSSFPLSPSLSLTTLSRSFTVFVQLPQPAGIK